VTEVVLAHLADIHFGGRADLEQLAALERFLPTLEPRAIVVAGDLSQRARHGELQAARGYLDHLARTAPVHVIPGNHDVQWWRSPFGIAGQRPKFAKWRQYFGEDLTPVLRLEGVVIAGLRSANGLAWGSLTSNPNDLTVKGHLPRADAKRVRALFASMPPELVRVAVLHHNVLPGVISNRWGMARPHWTQRALLSLQADLVLCGHDHTEGAGQIDGRLVVSTAGTHSVRTRGGRPSAFNLVRVRSDRIHIEHYLYVREMKTFRQGGTAAFARYRGATGFAG
jgi:3',5'-cyclic AMP phosphodiesterase CpdA